MAQEISELRRINWRSCFPFVNLFRTFRIAVQPGKLAIALLGVLLMGAGGWFLDAVWSQRSQPVQNEVNAFWQTSNIDEWREEAKAAQKTRLQYLANKAALKLPADWSTQFDRNPIKLIKQLQRDLLNVRKTPLHPKADDDGFYNKTWRELDKLKPQGVFASFMSFERRCLAEIFTAARGLKLDAGFEQALMARSTGFKTSRLDLMRQDAITSLVSVRGDEQMGVAAIAVVMLRGVQWLAGEHWFFSLILLGFVLALWSLLGGAICRMTALEFARDERIAPKAALSFSTRKFVSFFAAPLLPLGIALVIGLCLFIGGVVTAIPYLGELIGGAASIFFLVAGGIIAMLFLGFCAGGYLMWPTIAVEDSDSFDAMSRSYSYVFARPWQLLFNALVMLVYGSLCYLFVRFLVLLAMKAARFFVGVGLAGTPRPGTGISGATKIDTLWPAPSYEYLMGTLPTVGRQGLEGIGAFLIGIAVIVLVSLVCAFVVSFFLSGSTVIYYLMRRAVDGTDLEEVYLDESETEPETTSPAVSGEEPAASGAATVPPPPPAEPSSSPPPVVEENPQDEGNPEPPGA